MKKVLIIGAGFLQAFVIKKAKELGYITLAVDANPEAVGFCYADDHAVINIVDKEACLEYARTQSIDGVLTAATDYGVLTASYIAEQMGLNGINYKSAELIKNKYRVRKCLYENHVDDTEQAYEVDGDTDLAELTKVIRYPVMVKPCDGSGSRGAGRVDSPEAFAEACRLAMSSSITGRAVVETFIVGKEYGIESFVENGNIHVMAVMKKWMTAPPYYAELGHAIPSGLSDETENYVKECATRAIRALGVNFGSVNMDALITDDGKVYIVDIGARMGGNLIGSHIIPLGTGIEYIPNMIRAAVGDAIDFSRGEHHSVATRLLALTPGMVRSLPDFDSLCKEYNVVVEHHLHINDEITPYRTNLDGCGYVVVARENADEASECAELVKKIIDREIER